jgi:hypothetical protein
MASRGFGCSPAALLANASYTHKEVLVSFGEVILLPENDNHRQFTGTVARATSLSHPRYEFLGLKQRPSSLSLRGREPARNRQTGLALRERVFDRQRAGDPQCLCAALLVGLSAI